MNPTPVNGLKGADEASEMHRSQVSDDRTVLPYFKGYFKTFPAMLRVSELLIMFIAFILSCTDHKFLTLGGSWLTVTACLAFCSSLFFLIFHVFLLHKRVAAPWTIIELAINVLICLFIFSSGVLSAAYSFIGGLIIAETIFIFIALAIYLVDGLVAFKLFSTGHYYD